MLFFTEVNTTKHDTADDGKSIIQKPYQQQRDPLTKLPNHPKDLRLLIKILTNIINHPNEQKYRDINAMRVKKLFINGDECFQLLFHAGFQISNNNERLLCNDPYFNRIKSLIQKLQSALSATTETTIQPIKTPLSRHEFDTNDSAVTKELDAFYEGMLCDLV